MTFAGAVALEHSKIAAAHLREYALALEEGRINRFSCRWDGLNFHARVRFVEPLEYLVAETEIIESEK